MDQLNKIIIENEALNLAAKKAYIAAAEAQLKEQNEKAMKRENELEAKAKKQQEEAKKQQE